MVDGNFRMTNSRFGLSDDDDKDDIIRFCLHDEGSPQIFKNGYCLFNITHSGIDFYWYVGHHADKIGVDTDVDRKYRLKVIGIDLI